MFFLRHVQLLDRQDNWKRWHCHHWIRLGHRSRSSCWMVIMELHHLWIYGPWSYCWILLGRPFLQLNLRHMVAKHCSLCRYCVSVRGVWSNECQMVWRLDGYCKHCFNWILHHHQRHLTLSRRISRWSHCLQRIRTGYICILTNLFRLYGRNHNSFHCWHLLLGETQTFAWSWLQDK